MTLRAVQKGVRPCSSPGHHHHLSTNPHALRACRFQKAHPDIKIKLDVGSSAEMEKTLLSGQNDVIIIANPHTSRKMQAFPLCEEELVLIASNRACVSREKRQCRF